MGPGESLPTRLRHCLWWARDTWRARGALGWRYTLPVAARKVAAELLPSDRRDQALHDTLRDFADRHFHNPTPALLTHRAQRMRVWVVWWQGRDRMPPLVGTCVESLRQCLPFPLTIVSRDNVGEHVRLPDVVRRRLDEGHMSLPALSDYLRMALLAEHGGVWADATLLLREPIPASRFDTLYATLRLGPTDRLVAHGRWCGHLLATNQRHARHFEQLRMLFEEMWRQCDTQPDYLMVDYLTDFLYRHDPLFQQIVDDVPPTPMPHYDALNALLREPYDAARWQTIAASPAFKLRLSPDPAGARHHDTFYQRLIEGRLPRPTI